MEEVPTAGGDTRGTSRTWLLFATVLVIATAGIVYELVAGAIASYVLGDSVTQFSIVIGVYLSALGFGAFLSRYIDDRLARTFVEVEFATALAGGFSAPILFLSYAYTRAFPVILYGTVAVVGTLVGLELPLLIRILRKRVELKELISRALTFDYLGALVGSLLFSLLLVPKLGLVRTSLVFGLLNACVGIASTWFVGEVTPGELRGARARGFIIAFLLIVGLTQSERVTSISEDQIYADDVIFAKQTHYQRIVLTKSQHSFQLFLNGNLQFASADEYRYHESLVHPAFASAKAHRRILIAGGGDGLAAREVFRYGDVESVTLVDIDPEMTTIASSIPLMRELNEGSLANPKMHAIHEDAMVWLTENHERFDVIIVDFPDPNNFALGKLYTTRFYKLAHEHLAEGGAMVVQATSPLFARSSFWCIARTIEAAGFHVRPYHTAVPSFGEWGFVLAMKDSFEPPLVPALGSLRFLDEKTLASLFVLGPDMQEPKVEINHLNNQILVQYYEREWKRWN